MALRRLLGCLPAAALSFCMLTACKDKGNAAVTVELEKRCARVAKVCADQIKHVEKMVEECKQDAKTQTDKGCAEKAFAVYDCYEKELCGLKDKVWTLGDLRVLADRHKKCEPERKALNECTGK